jgi:YVTN family beta-propeller protein
MHLQSCQRRPPPAHGIRAALGLAALPVKLTVAMLLGAGIWGMADPAGAQGDAAGFVYTADEHGNSVSAIELRTGAVETAPVPISPHNIQITRDGRRLLAVGSPLDEGHDDAANGHGHNGKDGSQEAEEEDHDARGSNHDADRPEGLLVILDPDRLDAGPLASIPVGEHPAHVVMDRDGKRAFVTNAEDDSVAVVDLASGRIIRTIGTGRYPHGLRISPDGREAYVATVEEGRVSVIDTASLAEVARIEVGAAPVQVGFTPDGSRVYVSLRDENSVAIIDTASRRVVGKVPVGRNPIQVHATPDGRRIYVANQGNEDEPDQTVSVIEVATNKVVDTIRTGKGAHGVAVSDDGAWVFVTNIVDGTVAVIDEGSRAVTATFKVGKGPNGVTFRPGAT